MTPFKLSAAGSNKETLRQYKKLIKGDREGFHYFFNLCDRCIYFYCRYFVNEAESEDCTVRTFITLWNQREVLNFSSDNIKNQILQYLFVNARTECFNQLRLNNQGDAEELITQLMKEEDHFALLAIVKSFLIDGLKERIDALSVMLKTVVTMAFFEHWSDKQISLELQITEERVKELKRQALEELNLPRLIPTDS